MRPTHETWPLHSHSSVPVVRATLATLHARQLTDVCCFALFFLFLFGWPVFKLLLYLLLTCPLFTVATAAAVTPWHLRNHFVSRLF